MQLHGVRFDVYSNVKAKVGTGTSECTTTSVDMIIYCTYTFAHLSGGERVSLIALTIFAVVSASMNYVPRAAIVRGQVVEAIAPTYSA